MLRIYDKYGNLKTIAATGPVVESDPIWLADKPLYLTSALAASTYSLASHTHAFSAITSKPTTLSGYGITDATPSSRTLTINGVTYDLSANRSWTVSAVESDPVFSTWLAGPPNLSEFTDDIGFLTSETDPVFTASDAASITAGNISDWNTAFGWGNHASAGYATDSLVVHLSGTETITGQKIFTGGVGVGSAPHASAALAINSTTQGFLPAPMTNTQMLAIATPTQGLVVYNTTYNCLCYYDSDWGWWSDNKDWLRAYGIDVFEDFLGGVDRATLGSPYSPLFMTRIANSGLIRQAPGGSNRPGVINLSTSTSTNAQSGVITGDISPNGYLLGGGIILIESDVQVPTLSDGTNTFRWWWGFSNNVQAPAGVGISSVVFYYDANNAFGYGGSPNWQLMTCRNNARSITVTSVPVVAGQWYRLKIVINASATQVDFSIDGTIVRSETNNIPATNIQLGLGCNLIKSAGVTERNIWLDYYRIKQKFTNVR